MPAAESTNDRPSRAASDDPPEPGTIIGNRYVVEGLLGRGGMSIVLRARDQRLGHLVALKILNGAGTRRGQHTRRFLREAQIIAQLQSDHVVNVLDVDTSSDPPYLAMELLEGQTVAALLAAHHRFPTDVALRVLMQACRGVAEAHALGVLHRDLKPSNLVVARAPDGGQRVKVIDFGISKPILEDPTQPDLTTTGEILGSPRYMSPEQVRAGGKLDARSDIWALGAILYELLAGVSPFEAPTVADTLARIVRDTPTPLREHGATVPPRVASLVALCLSKDPALRPPDVLALLEELDAVTPPGPLCIDEVPLSGTETWGMTTQRTGNRSSTLAPASRRRRLKFGSSIVFAASALLLVALGWRAFERDAAAPLPPVATPALSPLVAPSDQAPSAVPTATIEDVLAVASERAPEPTSRWRPLTYRRAPVVDAGARDDDLELNRRE